MYVCFVRSWWRVAKQGSRFFPGLEPNPGARKTVIAKVRTQEEARRVCAEYNATHKPGKLSRKAEYTSA